MAKLDKHPTVVKVRSLPQQPVAAVSVASLKQLAIEFGADDCGVVSIERPELDDQRDDILQYAPWTKTLISFVCRMNREPLKSTARSIANLEFHHAGGHVNEVSRKLVTELEARGIRTVNPSMGFPMEMDRFPNKTWIVSHKPVAVAAGLGKMGIHRNVIHPKFGNFILLGTVLIDQPIDESTGPQSQPIAYNPCLECKLCVAACPVGAILPDGSFNFSSCYAHNYREFMGGFTDWVEDIAESKSKADYRQRTDDSESASWWQSLSYGSNYKAAYCLSVCPAGEDVIAPFLQDRADFVSETLKPLQAKIENVYVMPGTDAEAHAQKRFPHKTIRRVGTVLRPTSIRGFIRSMHLVFQHGKSKGLDAVYHFRFTRADRATVSNETDNPNEATVECTVIIKDMKIEVRDGLQGTCNLFVTADSRSWVRFLRKETSIAWLLATFRVRPRGDPRLLVKFGKCFP